MTALTAASGFGPVRAATMSRAQTDSMAQTLAVVEYVVAAKETEADSATARAAALVILAVVAAAGIVVIALVPRIREVAVATVIGASLRATPAGQPGVTVARAGPVAVAFAQPELKPPGPMAGRRAHGSA